MQTFVEISRGFIVNTNFIQYIRILEDKTIVYLSDDEESQYEVDGEYLDNLLEVMKLKGIGERY